MNKLLTIIGGSFFILEAVFISIFLLEISKELIYSSLPWIVGGAINIGFLIVLLIGAFRKQ